MQINVILAKKTTSKQYTTVHDIKGIQKSTWLHVLWEVNNTTMHYYQI